MSAKNFVITGTERVGSSTFANSLRFHESIACGWEWSRRVPWHKRLTACQVAMRGDFGQLANRHQEHMATEFTDATTCLGYRSLFRANDKWLFRPSLALSLQLDRYFETVAWWRRNPDIHVLHIIRTNNLAWLRSKFVARKADSFGAGKAYSADMTVTIPVHGAVKRLVMKQWLDSQLNRLKQSNPYHLVCYEELLEDRDSVITKAQAFLGFDVQLMPKEQVRKRQSKGISIEQHVTNYSRLVSVLDREGLTTAPLPNDKYCRPR